MNTRFLLSIIFAVTLSYGARKWWREYQEQRDMAELPVYLR